MSKYDSVGEYWEAFSTAVFGPDGPCCSEHASEQERAFYTGAMCALSIFKDKVARAGTAREGMEVIKKFEVEINEWVAKVKQSEAEARKARNPENN